MAIVFFAVSNCLTNYVKMNESPKQYRIFNFTVKNYYHNSLLKVHFTTRVESGLLQVPDQMFKGYTFVEGF